MEKIINKKLYHGRVDLFTEMMSTETLRNSGSE
jgi:hypothetical protein